MWRPRQRDRRAAGKYHMRRRGKCVWRLAETETRWTLTRVCSDRREQQHGETRWNRHLLTRRTNHVQEGLLHICSTTFLQTTKKEKRVKQEKKEKPQHHQTPLTNCVILRVVERGESVNSLLNFITTNSKSLVPSCKFSTKYNTQSQLNHNVTRLPSQIS